MYDLSLTWNFCVCGKSILCMGLLNSSYIRFCTAEVTLYENSYKHIFDIVPYALIVVLSYMLQKNTYRCYSIYNVAYLCCTFSVVHITWPGLCIVVFLELII